MAKKKKKKNGKPNTGLAAVGVAFKVAQRHGFVEGFNALQAGDWGLCISEIGSRSNTNDLVNSAVDGAILGGFRNWVGSVPLVRNKKRTISVFGR